MESRALAIQFTLAGQGSYYLVNIHLPQSWTKMPGISAIGTHIPRLRLPLSLIHAPEAKPSGAVKAVADFDEDVITMAVAAARDCLANLQQVPIDGLYLASTTSPFSEKSAAAIVAKALNQGEDIQCVDFGGSLRASASALRAAIDAIAQGRATRILVIASDMRAAKPYSGQEQHLGDAAVALLVDTHGPLQLEADTVVSRQLYDVWREDGAATLRHWEDRFILQHGYEEGVLAAMERFVASGGPGASSVSQVASFAPDARSARGLPALLGHEPAQQVSPLFGQVGNCGVAMTPLLMAQAAESLAAGERLLTIFYGDGAHVMSWILADDPGIARSSLAAQLAAGVRMHSYRHFLQCRGLEGERYTVNPADGISATVSYREQEADIAFVAARCLKCGTEQFPPARLCYRCHNRDCFEPVALASRNAQVASYTFDYFFPSPKPPIVAGMCEVEGGARVYLQMADYEGEALETGLPVEFVFRRIHASGGKPAYFWKSRLLGPETDAQENEKESRA